MSAFTAMAEIEAFTGAGSKKSKLDRIKKLTPDERAIFCLAYDPDRVFYYLVNPDDIGDRYSDKKISDHDAEVSLLSVCDNLSGRHVTGNMAAGMVTEFLLTLDQRQRMWAERVINKDLCIGVSEKTFLKAFPGHLSCLNAC